MSTIRVLMARATIISATSSVINEFWWTPQAPLCIFSPAAGFQAPDMNDFFYVNDDVPPHNHDGHRKSAK